MTPVEFLVMLQKLAFCNKSNFYIIYYHLINLSHSPFPLYRGVCSVGMQCRGPAHKRDRPCLSWGAWPSGEIDSSSSSMPSNFFSFFFLFNILEIILTFIYLFMDFYIY